MTLMHVQPSEIERSPAAEVMATGGAMMQTRASYATAVQVQKPRTLAAVLRRLEDEAALAGESFYYGWGAGKDRVEGPSTELAHAAARCWGNCAIEMQPVQETLDAWIFTAVFVDLETGFTLPRQFRQSKKWAVYGKMDEERKADVRFQIGQSKAIRNVVLNALPASLIDKALDKAKAGVRQKIEDLVADKGLAAAVDMSLRALQKVGVPEARILAKLNIAKREAITAEHLVLLSGDWHAINSGRETADALFPNGADKTAGLNAAITRPHPTAEGRTIDTSTSNLPPDEQQRQSPDDDPDVSGIEAEAPTPDLSTYESWYEAMTGVFAGNSNFSTIVHNLGLNTAVKKPGKAGQADRDRTYAAAVAGKIGPDGKVNG